MTQSPLEARFWSKVNKNGPVPAHKPHLGPCWIWTGSDRHRYPRFWMNGKSYSAHRVSYEFANGPVPDGLYVCHFCDNTRCVNDSHIVAATPTWNAKDATDKGRMTGLDSCLRAHHEGRVNYSKGEHRHNAKMTNSKVIEMRRLHKVEHLTVSQLSKLFGLSYTPTNYIVLGKTWKHLIGTTPPATGEAAPNQTSLTS